jgi:uncharacterized protein (DUF952 family)
MRKVILLCQSITYKKTIMKLIYKILPNKIWQKSLKIGFFAGSPVDIEDGFIHFSNFEQVFETATKYFNIPDDLLIFAMNPDYMGNNLKWEASRGGALFPHFYGVIDPKDVYFIKALPFDDKGQHIFPDLLNA